MKKLLSLSLTKSDLFSNDLVHRDLKPENILIQTFKTPKLPRVKGSPSTLPRRSSASQSHSFYTSPRSTHVPKICDFGLATEIEMISDSRAARIVGTYDFFAPEIIRAQAGDNELESSNRGG